jgi:predicted RNase H-like nuclease (RuvC/YqgF family)
MQTWLTLEEFCKLSGKTKKEVISACKNKELKCKKSEGVIYIEIKSLASAIVTAKELEIKKNSDIAERIIGMLLTLYEKVLMSKDETIEALKEENEFLKNSVYSIQEVYENSQEMITMLQKQLEICQNELEFCKKKYKLMWGKVLKKEDSEQN